MIAAHPKRFVASLYVDPRLGMAAVRAIEEFKRDHDIRLVRMLGFKTQLPYDHAIYYPVYAKCAELGIPVGLNVGIPGPAVPGACQDPINIEPVLAFFPELEVIMCHGGEPWQAMCVKMMIKWKNLYYMTSAFSPKYVPIEIMNFLNSSRGIDRIMFASDYPMLSFDRCREEIENNLVFKNDEVKKAFLWDNAERLFFTGAEAAR
jgi:predicted TIM-barrel fold metal-dependent hydrolase